MRDFRLVTSQTVKRTVLLSRRTQGQGQVQGRSVCLSTGGVHGPGGCLVPWGCLLRGCLFQGVSAPGGSGRERRLLLRMVRILLECILVAQNFLSEV